MDCADRSDEDPRDCGTLFAYQIMSYLGKNIIMQQCSVLINHPLGQFAGSYFIVDELVEKAKERNKSDAERNFTAIADMSGKCRTKINYI